MFAAAPSKVPYYIVGGLLAAWAVLLAVWGISHIEFPGSHGRARWLRSRQEEFGRLKGESPRVSAQRRRGGATRPATSVTVVHAPWDTVARVRGPRLLVVSACSQ